MTRVHSTNWAPVALNTSVKKQFQERYHQCVDWKILNASTAHFKPRILSNLCFWFSFIDIPNQLKSSVRISSVCCSFYLVKRGRQHQPFLNDGDGNVSHVSLNDFLIEQKNWIYDVCSFVIIDFYLFAVCILSWFIPRIEVFKELFIDWKFQLCPPGCSLTLDINLMLVHVIKMDGNLCLSGFFLLWMCMWMQCNCSDFLVCSRIVVD